MAKYIQQVHSLFTFVRQLRRSFAAAALLAICLLPAACKKKQPAPELPVTQPPVISTYNDLFFRTSGWTGGDGAASIPLSAQKILWLFGDSFNGTIADNKRTNTSLKAHNTIAIQDGISPSAATLNYFFGAGSSSFFTPFSGSGFLWPMHGTMINDQLYIFFVQADTAAGGLGFKLTNSVLVKVSNPLDPPAQWQSTQWQVPHALFSPTLQTVFGASVLQKDGYLYIFGTKTDNSINDRHLLLARVKPDSIAGFSSWKFLDNGQWTSNFQNAQHLNAKMGFEFSVSYFSQQHKFVLVNAPLGFAQNINVQSADSLSGSWSSPVNVFQCPEPKSNSNVFCYAAKAHPELSSNNDLVITYVANSVVFSDVINDASLYWPRFISVSP